MKTDCIILDNEATIHAVILHWIIEMDDYANNALFVNSFDDKFTSSIAVAANNIGSVVCGMFFVM